jgi:Domain of unknown function (DUF3883)
MLKRFEMSKYWITMQYLQDLKDHSIWVKDKMGYKNSAELLTKGDFVAIYVGHKFDGPSSIYRLAQVREKYDNPEREPGSETSDYWLKVADIKFIAENGECPLEEVINILAPDQNTGDRRNMGRYLNSRFGSKIAEINEGEFDEIGSFFMDYDIKSKEISNKMADDVEAEFEAAVPGLLPIDVKRAIERYAVKQAKLALKDYNPVETPRYYPYDLTCIKDRVKYFVEVKGTQKTGEIISIFLTPNELTQTRTHINSSLLFVLHSIKVENVDGKPIASEGQSVLFNPWTINENSLKISLYQYFIKTTEQ